MSTFHAVVWMDHHNAHVLMFDREHVQAERIQSRSTHSHQGKHADTKSYFAEISHGLAGVHEVLLTGPGTARTEFRTWCEAHAKGCAHAIIDNDDLTGRMPLRQHAVQRLPEEVVASAGGYDDGNSAHVAATLFSHSRIAML